MKKKLTILLCVIFVMGTFGFGQLSDKWIKKPFTEILELNKQLLVKELASAPSATTGYGTIYVKSADGLLYFKTGAGVESDLTAGAGSDNYTVKVDAAATAGYFGVAIGDGIFRGFQTRRRACASGLRSNRR